MKKNTNCLAGLACPQCHSTGPLRIVATCLAVVTDDGVEETSEFEWGDDASCTCTACGHRNTVAQFDTLRLKRA